MPLRTALVDLRVSVLQAPYLPAMHPVRLMKPCAACGRNERARAAMQARDSFDQEERAWLASGAAVRPVRSTSFLLPTARVSLSCVDSFGTIDCARQGAAAFALGLWHLNVFLAGLQPTG